MGGKTPWTFFGLALGADVEGKTGGNPASTVGVDYAKLLRRSDWSRRGSSPLPTGRVDLQQDPTALGAAERIAADPAARNNLAEISTFTGRIADPMLTLHTAGDQLAVVEQEDAYARTVKGAGRGALLRQAYTERAVHCAFTPAEIVAALGALTARVHTGSWKHVTPQQLQAGALALGPDLNVHVEDDPAEPIPTDPAFTALQPGPFPRPFDRN